MGPIIERIILHADQQPTESVLLQVEQDLGDARVVRTQLESDDDVQSLCANLFDEAHKAVRNAFTTFPAIRGEGFHSGMPDLRPHALYATFSELPRERFYLPHELDDLANRTDASAEWIARERLRTLAIMWLVNRAIRELTGGKLNAKQYRQLLRAIGATLGGPFADSKLSAEN